MAFGDNIFLQYQGHKEEVNYVVASQEQCTNFSDIQGAFTEEELHSNLHSLGDLVLNIGIKWKA